MEAGPGVSSSSAKGRGPHHQNPLPWNSWGILTWISLGISSGWVLCGCLEWNHLRKALEGGTSTGGRDGAVLQAPLNLHGENIALPRNAHPKNPKPGSRGESCTEAASLGIFGTFWNFRNFWNCACKSPAFPALTSLLYVL